MSRPTSPPEDLRSGYDAAAARLREGADGVIVESYIKGEDHRILVIGGKLVAAARRRPAHVTGDGAKQHPQLDREENVTRAGASVTRTC